MSDEAAAQTYAGYLQAAIDADQYADELDEAREQLATCRRLLAALVAAETERRWLNEHVSDTSVTEDHWEQRERSMIACREVAYDQSIAHLAAHPAPQPEGGQDAR